eukprot:s489_g22.t1
MADLSAVECLKAHRRGKFFSLEHPRNSIARKLSTWEELESEPGVVITPYHACMFEGGRRRKAEVLIHNIPGIDKAIGLECHSSGICSRTGRPHLPWRPRVVNGRVTSFATSEEREYPQGFCRQYAEAAGVATQHSDSTFLEIFSGPNAPLSRAVAEEWSVPPPPPVEAIPRRDWREHSEIRTLVSTPRSERKETPASSREEQPSQERGASEVVPEESHSLRVSSSASPSSHPETPLGDPPPVETNPYRAARVEASSQPSYGKRTQLIPDGLGSPGDHLQVAKNLSHPFSASLSLKSIHRDAINLLREDAQSLIANRFKSIDLVRKWESELGSQQKRGNLRASWTATKLGTKPNTVLMRKLQNLLQIEDKELPDLCLSGMSITGRALCSPFFDSFEIPPSMSSEEFFADLVPRSKRMVERVRFMGKKSDPRLATAIWEKTQKEIRAGTMGPPLTWEEVRAAYNDDFQVTPSFGLSQGVGPDGEPKFRRIDDHSASGVNPSAHRLQKVPMTMVDYIGVLLKNLAQVSSEIYMTTEDMKAAYRQIPLAPQDVRYAITGVFNPHTGSVDLHELHGQPFGAGHAVPNFCRAAEWISRCAQRLFMSLVDHFFDDFFIIEPHLAVQSSLFCLQQLFISLGFALDPEKSQPPSQVCAILGIVFNTASLRDQRTIRLCAKQSRLDNLISMIDSVLSSESLSPAMAASLVGKFSFLCSTLFGKVGRCCTGPVRQRQYSSSKWEGLSHTLVASLRLMKFFLLTSPARELSLSSASPVILYTDASDVPTRTPQRLLGAVLYDPLSNELLFSNLEVPTSVVSKWLPRKSFMGQLELLAAPFAFDTWRNRLEQREIILFCDNDSAGANLVKGYSPIVDSTSIVGEFWLLVSALRAHVYIDRVESKSNLADGPSRGDFTEVLALGGIWSSPKFGTLGEPSIPSLSQLGTLEHRGEREEVKPNPYCDPLSGESLTDEKAIRGLHGSYTIAPSANVGCASSLDPSQFPTWEEKYLCSDAVMRVELDVSKEHLARLATGFVVALKGTATQAGTFTMSDFCFPRKVKMASWNGDSDPWFCKNCRCMRKASAQVCDRCGKSWKVVADPNFVYNPGSRGSYVQPPRQVHQHPQRSTTYRDQGISQNYSGWQEYSSSRSSSRRRRENAQSQQQYRKPSRRRQNVNTDHGTQHSQGKAQGKGKDTNPADFGPPVLPMGMSDTPWMNQASSNALPPLPPPALSEAEEKLRAYDQLFKKHKDALTPEFQTDLQQITKEDKIKETEVTTNVLHKQVTALGHARKELAAANSARTNLHVSWRAFLTDQVQKWKTYSSNFQSQEEAMSQRVTEAIAAVEAAKTDFVNSKKSLGDMSITEEVQTISDDDMDHKQSSASGAQISDSLAHLTSSLQQLQENADQAIIAEQQAAKRPRLEEMPAPTPSALPPEGAPPFH